jgi:hypothetical protein
MKHYNFYRFSMFFLFSLTFSSLTFTQEPPIKWGEIPRGDLEMRSFPQDTNASAVILCDFGDSYITEKYNNIFKKHVRIKILSSKGYPFGTHSFIIYRDWRNERVRDLEGITYWINDRNEIEKEELKENDILMKKIDSRRNQYWFTLPALRPGCVLEIRYTIISKSIQFKDWTFQKIEPVRMSEYRILFPREIGFSAIHQGTLPYAIRENNNVIEKVLYSTERECTKMRWVVSNAPALRPEPFMTSVNDYVKKLSIQLSGFAIPGYYMGDILSNWGQFGKELHEDEDFGERIKDTRAVRNVAEQITAGLSSQEEKMRAIYAWVSKSIVWSGTNTPFAWQEGDEILKSKKGSNADINFLLLSLLKTVEIKGYPVILSTRENGKFTESYPVVSQFDYMLAKAVIDSQNYYFDATDPNRPIDLLPTQALNMKGLVFTDASLEWTKFTTPKKFSNISAAMISLSKDGSLSGSLDDLYRDYGSLEMRNNIANKNELDITKELFDTELQGFSIDSLHIDAKDSVNKPLKIKAWISSSTYAQTNGDLIYFNPHMLHRIKENPLKNEKRIFPLDYSFQHDYSSTINLTIPDSFEVRESIANRNMVIGSNLAQFSRKVIVQGNQIRIQYKWEIRETEIDTVYYARMRDFYAQIISIESEQFVFARSKPLIVPSITGSKKEANTSKKKGKR